MVHRMSCERTRSLISRGHDAPLHELEQRFVTSHVARCEECSAFREETAWFTALLRDAPLEPIPSPVSLPSRVNRHHVRLRSLAQIASVVAVAVTAGTIAFEQHRGFASGEQTFVAAPLAESATSTDSIRALRRDDLSHGRLAILPEDGPGPRGVGKQPLPAAGG